MTRVTATYAPVAFKDLPGWIADDHRAAYGAFLKSCERLIVLSRTDSKVKAGAAHLALCVKAAQLPDVRKKLEDLGLDLQLSSPQAFGALLKSETVKWAEVIRLTGVKVD